MNTIQVLIVDDHALIRDGLKTILELEDDMEVVGAAEGGEKAYDMVKKLRPQVVLMDIRMNGMNGVESTRLIKKDFPDTSVIMLTTFDEEEYIMEAFRHGANGYLLKDMPGDDIVHAVRYGASGNLIMPRPVAAKVTPRIFSLYEGSHRNTKIHINELSDREKQIAHYMIMGFNNKKIASTLYITEGTVKNYISSIYSKIGISDRTKAVLYFKELGLE